MKLAERLHTYIVTVDNASLEAAKRNEPLQVAMMARLLIFTSKQETIRPDGRHYMKRAGCLTAYQPTS